MKNILQLGLTAAATMLLVGCASSRVAGTPRKISLEAALRSVGQGLREMHEAQKNVKTGLVPAEVIVTFNITAAASDEGKLCVELGALPAAGGTAKTGGEIGSTTSAARGNQITVKFTNLLLANKDTLVYKHSPEEIQKLLEMLEKSGIQMIRAPDPKARP